jgi:hypothetical protein
MMSPIVNLSLQFKAHFTTSQKNPATPFCYYQMINSQFLDVIFMFVECSNAGGPMTANDLAHAFGVPVPDIRRYEAFGLLIPGPGASYGLQQRIRLEVILKATRLGFSLDELQIILRVRAPRCGE